jgi:TolB-like protein/DNA-binding winged helix-turn-helix (wHTH) protein/Flp pilus assembly protein TadD
MGTPFFVDEWLVEPDLNRISRAGKEVQIEPKVMDLLAYLAAHPGEVCSREQILKAVWASTFVSDEALGYAVSELRKALGDSARNPVYIATIAKRGYRLIAPVLQAPEQAPAIAPDHAAATKSSGQAVSRSRLRKTAALMTLVAAALVLIIWSLGVRRERTADGPVDTVSARSVAILPLANLSNDQAQEYFSAGITEDIISYLARNPQLQVISRTSVMQYKGSSKNLRQIGKELGAAYVLEGSVRRDADRVRVVANLIDARTDRHLWAGTYDRKTSDLFAIQSEVAEQVAAALNATLSSAGRGQLQKSPTGSLEAYDYYLLGNDYFSRGYGEQEVRAAARMYARAIELDSNFTLALARLSETYSHMFWYQVEPTAECADRAKAAADRALKLQPDLPEAHRAVGYYYYYCRLDYARALKEFETALEGKPNDSHARSAVGYILRRQGKMELARTELVQAFVLDPRSATIAHDVGETYALLRSPTEAMAFFDRSIELNPDWSDPYHLKAMAALRLEGDTRKARTVLTAAERLGVRDLVWTWVALNLAEGNYREALARLEASQDMSLDGVSWFIPRPLLSARTHGFVGDGRLERRDYELARQTLEAKVREQPEDSRLHSALGIAYAGLRLKKEAIREGELALQLMPLSKDAFRGNYRIEDLAQIYAMVGEPDKAIDRLADLLSRPGDLSVKGLLIDPAWKPLRELPRFNQIVALYGK